MADESVERRDHSPGRSGLSGHEGETGRASRASNLRRIIISTLLAPPAVMTLGSRSASAKNSGPSKSQMASANR